MNFKHTQTGSGFVRLLEAHALHYGYNAAVKERMGAALRQTVHARQDAVLEAFLDCQAAA